MLTVKEVAKELKLHPITVYRLIQRGELKAIRLGKRQGIRIDEADLKNFIKSKKYSRRKK